MPILEATEPMVWVTLFLGSYLWGFAFHKLILDWVIRVGDVVVLGRLVVEVVELVVERTSVLNWGNLVLIYWRFILCFRLLW